MGLPHFRSQTGVARFRLAAPEVAKQWACTSTQHFFAFFFPLNRQQMAINPNHPHKITSIPWMNGIKTDPAVYQHCLETCSPSIRRPAHEALPQSRLTSKGDASLPNYTYSTTKGLLPGWSALSSHPSLIDSNHFKPMEPPANLSRRLSRQQREKQSMSGNA